jgi:MFS family permease
MQRSVSANIWYLYLIKISHWFMLFMPVVVPFYESNGLGIDQLLIIQAVYSVSIVILEIPSGYLADGLGRRITIILGTVFALFGFGCYAILHGFFGFLIAEVMLGIGASLISGADSAILYDSLIELNRSNDYVRIEGRVTSIGNFSEATAGIIGGLLAGYAGIRYPYYFQTGIALLGIPAALLLLEPESHKARARMSFRAIVPIVKYALVDHKLLRRNIIYSSVIGASTLTMAWFVQPYFKLVGIPLSSYGFLWTSLNLTVAVMALLAYRLEKHLGEARIIILVTVFIAAGYILTGVFATRWALIFIFMFYMIRGIATPVLKDYINRLTSSEMRATVLSIRNFIIRILFAIIGPFLGWFSQRISLPAALLLAGVSFFLMGATTVILYIFLLSKKQDNPPFSGETGYKSTTSPS